jgi:hypothetical protein
MRRESFSSPTINPSLNLIQNALECITFRNAKENGETKMNISLGFEVVGEGIENGGRGGRIGILTETDGGFVSVDGLTRLGAIFGKA